MFSKTKKLAISLSSQLESAPASEGKLASSTVHALLLGCSSSLRKSPGFIREEVISLPDRKNLIWESFDNKILMNYIPGYYVKFQIKLLSDCITIGRIMKKRKKENVACVFQETKKLDSDNY